MLKVHVDSIKREKKEHFYYFKKNYCKSWGKKKLNCRNVVMFRYFIRCHTLKAPVAVLTIFPQNL